MKKILFSILLISTFIACNNKKKSEETKNSTPIEIKTELTSVEKITNKLGYQNWNDVSEISYTFNVKRGEMNMARSWVWNPKTDDVKMTSVQDTISYNRKAMDSLSKITDKAFINDKFWLLAPFNLVSDTGVNFTEKQGVSAPISGKKLNQLTAVYSNDGGYTPGDAYDFYYNSDFKIKEWSFRKGNQEKPNLSTTWEGYETFNNITLSKTRNDSIGFFSIYFTDISIKN